jgi:tRNA threonylcarbamoyl adenosine modification protein YeaZ
VLLAVESSTDAVSVAVHDGNQILGQARAQGARQHAEVLVPSIRQCLADSGIVLADVTAIAVGVGPGAFTGLRVGIVTAQTMAAARHVPCHGVVSADVTAHGHGTAGDVAVVMDARRGEVFWAIYRDGQRVKGPSVGAPDVVAAQIPSGAVILGDAGERYALIFPTIRLALPSAAAMASEGAVPACA